jgi:hypothetical protein
MPCACSCAGNNPGRKVIVRFLVRTLLGLWSIAAVCGALITPIYAQASTKSTSAGFPTYMVVPGEPVKIGQADQVLRAGGGWSLTGAAHIGLAGASFCPMICGSAFSTVDACLYAVQGDYVTAGISIAAAGAGIMSDAGAAKLLGLGIKAGVETTAANKLAKTADQIVLKTLVNEATSGGRKALSKQESEIVIQWAQEMNYPGLRASAKDLASPSNWTANPVPHFHLDGVGRRGHISVASGLTPLP